VQLTTPSGRTITVEDETDDQRGRVFYRVSGVGTLTIDRDPYAYAHDREPGLRVTYGLLEADYHGGYRLLPEAPEVFGVQLVGGWTVYPDDLTEARTRPGGIRGHARRYVSDFSSQSAPDKTRQRVGDIVAALVDYHLTRPDLTAIDTVQARRYAPGRLAEHQRTISDLTRQIEELEARRSAEMARADAQLALIGP